MQRIPLQCYVATFTKQVNKSAIVMNKLMRSGWKPSKSTVRSWLNLSVRFDRH
jgi:hypothetical protein